MPRFQIASTTMSMFLFAVAHTLAVPLAPDDASIADGLVSWHRNASTNFANGIWKASVGLDLVALGEAGDGDEYEIPELSNWTPEEGFFEGLSNVAGVLFSADVSDMLWAKGVNGGDGFDELTLIGVYQTTGNSDRTRPIGIGSRTEAEAVLGDAFNLSADASLRYDNGNNQTDPVFHLPDLTYRVGQLFDGSVNDYLDGEIITEEAFTGGSFTGITRNDDLYIGDVRGGILDGFAGSDPYDVFVAEVLVYKTVLSEQQVVGIGEWLQQNLTGGEAGNPCDFDSSGELDLADINLLREAVINSNADSKFDLNGDGAVNSNDIVSYIEAADKFNSFIGDSDLDGQFGSSDFVTVFQAGEFEDGVAMNSTWQTGDWNGDGEFGSSDLVLAFQRGGFEEGPRAAAVHSVPEPVGCWQLGLFIVLFGVRLQAKRRCSI